MNGLSAREQLVCSLIVEGLTNKEMAARLRISVATVNKHVAAAMRKLGARNKFHLAALVVRAFSALVGICEPGAVMAEVSFAPAV